MISENLGRPHYQVDIWALYSSAPIPEEAVGSLEYFPSLDISFYP